MQFFWKSDFHGFQAKSSKIKPYQAIFNLEGLQRASFVPFFSWIRVIWPSLHVWECKTNTSRGLMSENEAYSAGKCIFFEKVTPMVFKQSQTLPTHLYDLQKVIFVQKLNFEYLSATCFLTFRTTKLVSFERRKRLV